MSFPCVLWVCQSASQLMWGAFSSSQRLYLASDIQKRIVMRFSNSTCAHLCHRCIAICSWLGALLRPPNAKGTPYWGDGTNVPVDSQRGPISDRFDDSPYSAEDRGRF